MHHKTNCNRVQFGWLVLLVPGIGLLTANVTHAEEPDKNKQILIVVVPLNTSKDIQMSTKQPIVRIRFTKSDKTANLQVSPVCADLTYVRLTGKEAGKVRVELTDEKGAVEEFDIVIKSVNDK